MRKGPEKNFLNELATAGASAHLIGSYVLVYTLKNNGMTTCHRGGNLATQLGMLKLVETDLIRGTLLPASILDQEDDE